MLDEQGGVQWPFPEGTSRSEDQPGQNKKTESFSKERRLFEDGKFFTEDGKARFLFSLPREMPEKPDDEYSFLLLTGRGTSLQWHTNTRTEKSDVLRKLYPKQCYVEINPKDAKRLGIRVNDVVSIASRRAEITCDRAGMLVAKDQKAAERAITKLAVGSRKLYEEFNVDAFLEQHEEGTHGIGKYMEVFATHPWLPKRVLAMRVFGDSQLYHKAVGGPSSGLSMSEVDEQVSALLKGDKQ